METELRLCRVTRIGGRVMSDMNERKVRFQRFESDPESDGEPLKSPERGKGTGIWMAPEVASYSRMS